MDFNLIFFSSFFWLLVGSQRAVIIMYNTRTRYFFPIFCLTSTAFFFPTQLLLKQISIFVRSHQTIGLGGCMVVPHHGLRNRLSHACTFTLAPGLKHWLLVVGGLYRGAHQSMPRNRRLRASVMHVVIKSTRVQPYPTEEGRNEKKTSNKWDKPKILRAWSKKKWLIQKRSNLCLWTRKTNTENRCDTY